MNEHLYNFFYRARGFLWLLLFVILMIILAYIDYFGLLIIPIWLILFSLGIVLTIRRLEKDNKSMKVKNRIKLFERVWHEMKDKEKRTDNNLIGKRMEPVSKEYFWSILSYAQFLDMEAFLNSFPYRFDDQSRRMMSSKTPNAMTSAIEYAYGCTNSVRLCYDKGLVSFNYNTPILISEVLAYNVVNERRFHSYSSSVKNNYTIFISLNIPGSSTIRLSIGENELLLQELLGELTRLGIAKL